MPSRPSGEALVSLDRCEVALQHLRVIDGAVVMNLPPMALRTTEEARRSYGELEGFAIPSQMTALAADDPEEIAALVRRVVPEFESIGSLRLRSYVWRISGQPRLIPPSGLSIAASAEVSQFFSMRARSRALMAR